MKKSEKAFYLFSTAVLIVIALMLYSYENKETIYITPFDPVKWFGEAHLNTSCNGVYAYYTGRGFTYDADILTKEALKIYEIDEGWNILPPMAIQTKEPGYDCEDISHAVLCMAAAYPHISCNYYYQEWNGQEFSHIGVNCTETFFFNNETKTQRIEF